MPLSAQQYELLETLETTAASDFWTDPTHVAGGGHAAHEQAGLVSHHDGRTAAWHCA